MKAKQILLVIFLLLLGSSSYAQLTKKYSWHVGTRDSIPQWVATARYIGISDPGLREDIAQAQAINRGWSIWQLSKGVKLSLVRDFYTKNEEYFRSNLSRDKVLSLATVELTPQDVSLRVVNSHTTQYGEVIVELAETDEISDSTTYHLPVDSTSRLWFEFMLSTSFDVIEKGDIRLEHTSRIDTLDVDSLHYIIDGSIKRSKVYSTINDTLYPIKRSGDYWFADLAPTNRDTTATKRGIKQEISLRNSLWSAFIESLLYPVLGYNYQNLTVKSVDESYEDKKHSLLRESAINNVAVHLDGINIEDNKLTVRWVVTNNFTQ